MIDTILVATDGSEAAASAERFGVALAKRLGARLAGMAYEPLFPYFAAHADAGAFRVRTADFVSTADGTGIVHVAPGFGEDDYALPNAQG